MHILFEEQTLASNSSCWERLRRTFGVRKLTSFLLQNSSLCSVLLPSAMFPSERLPFSSLNLKAWGIHTEIHARSLWYLSILLWAYSMMVPVYVLCVCPSCVCLSQGSRFLIRETAPFEREPCVFFFPSSQCLGVGLGSKGSVCQYLVIVSASIFISHSVWSLSPRVQPNYITWPCPVPLTPTPDAALNRDAAVAVVVSQRDQ